MSRFSEFGDEIQTRFGAANQSFGVKLDLVRLMKLAQFGESGHATGHGWDSTTDNPWRLAVALPELPWQIAVCRLRALAYISSLKPQWFITYSTERLFW